jgi:hypothetical protein
MWFERYNFAWLTFGILLFPETSLCTCFQNANQLQIYNKIVQVHPRIPSLELNARNIQPSLPSRRRKNKVKISRQGKKTLRISKYYFENLEKKSGKDYAWIKPLTQPLSQAMRYVKTARRLQENTANLTGT